MLREVIPGKRGKEQGEPGPEERKSQTQGGVIQISAVGTGTQFGWKLLQSVNSCGFHLREEDSFLPTIAILFSGQH